MSPDHASPCYSNQGSRSSFPNQSESVEDVLSWSVASYFRHPWHRRPTPTLTSTLTSRARAASISWFQFHEKQRLGNVTGSSNKLISFSFSLSHRYFFLALSLSLSLSLFLSHSHTRFISHARLPGAMFTMKAPVSDVLKWNLFQLEMVGLLDSLHLDEIFWRHWLEQWTDRHLMISIKRI